MGDLGRTSGKTWKGLIQNWHRCISIALIPLGYAIWTFYRSFAINDVKPDFSKPARFHLFCDDFADALQGLRGSAVFAALDRSLEGLENLHGWRTPLECLWRRLSGFRFYCDVRTKLAISSNELQDLFPCDCADSSKPITPAFLSILLRRSLVICFLPCRFSWASLRPTGSEVCLLFSSSSQHVKCLSFAVSFGKAGCSNTKICDVQS